MRPTTFLITMLAACGCLNTSHGAELDSSFFDGATLSEIPGIEGGVQVIRDEQGIAHIRAANVDDLFFMQGWVHSEDRLFQMDVLRHQASGTLAEMLGEEALEDDVQLRTLGMRRAAVRSLPELSPRTRRFVDRYTEGVNAYVAANPLPPQYAELELTQFEPWTALDTVTVAKLIALLLSFDQFDLGYSVTLQTYSDWGQASGFDGNALFFEDLYRTAPFEPAATVPDAGTPAPPPARPAAARRITADGRETSSTPSATPGPTASRMASNYLKRLRRTSFLSRMLDDDKPFGSNEWAVAGVNTSSGAPLVANDPHLALALPSTFYPIRLKSGPIDVIGSSFVGAPFVITGRNARIAWGATVHNLDVTDYYSEQLVRDPAKPFQFYTVYQGRNEPVQLIPEVFRYNQVGNGVPDDLGRAVNEDFDFLIPPATLIVPRRNNGPIVEVDDFDGLLAGNPSAAISVQYTGFSPTRELDAFRIFNEAASIDDFKDGLRFFDVGSENWAVADVGGNIAYFTSAEMPVREDLQAGSVNGLPPGLIRDGSGGNEWLRVQNPQPNQAVPYEILPYDEMPQLVNPAGGWFVNANNDPLGINFDNNPVNQLRPGGGIFYLSQYYHDGLRAARVTELVREKLATDDGKMSFEEMQEIQADVLLGDARALRPYIVSAYLNATETGADPTLAGLVSGNPRLSEAVWRLLNWNFTAPTGMPRGYDAADVDGVPGPLQPGERGNSVATTLYSVWRSQILNNTVDATLNRLWEDNGFLPADEDNLGVLPAGLRPPGRRALIALRHLLDTFDTNQGVGASGVDFFEVDGVAGAADQRDIIILQSLLDALDLLAGDVFEPVFKRSTDMSTYRWGRLHRLIMEHPLGGAYDIPPAGGAFPPVVAGLEGIPVDGGYETVDASPHDAWGFERDLEPPELTSEGFTYVWGPVNRFVSDLSGYGSRTESAWPGGTSGVLGDPNYANQLPGWLTNDTFPLTMRYDDTRPDAQAVDWYVPEGSLSGP
jgi:penicillin amidase